MKEKIIIIIIVIVVAILLLLEFFTPALADGLPLGFEK